MAWRDDSDDPILDATDVIGFGLLGVIGGVPLMVVTSQGWPLWTTIPAALAFGVVSIPAYAYFLGRLEAKRPSRLRSTDDPDSDA